MAAIEAHAAPLKFLSYIRRWVVAQSLAAPGGSCGNARALTRHHQRVMIIASGY